MFFSCRKAGGYEWSEEVSFFYFPLDSVEKTPSGKKTDGKMTQWRKNLGKKTGGEKIGRKRTSHFEIDFSPHLILVLMILFSPGRTFTLVSKSVKYHLFQGKSRFILWQGLHLRPHAFASQLFIGHLILYNEMREYIAKVLS